MDILQVGKFLAELRHSKGLTQEQLGERLGVTNKTISRWENGNYLPPVEGLQQLSKLYGVSINEILTGRILDEAEYKDYAEQNIKTVLETSRFTLKERIDFFKKKWKKEHAITLILQIVVLITASICGFSISKWLFFVVVIAGAAWGIIIYNRMMSYVEKHAFDGKEKE